MLEARAAAKAARRAEEEEAAARGRRGAKRGREAALPRLGPIALPTDADKVRGLAELRQHILGLGGDSSRLEGWTCQVGVRRSGAGAGGHIKTWIDGDGRVYRSKRAVEVALGMRPATAEAEAEATGAGAGAGAEVGAVAAVGAEELEAGLGREAAGAEAEEDEDNEPLAKRAARLRKEKEKLQAQRKRQGKVNQA